MTGGFLYFFLFRWLCNYLVDGNSDKFYLKAHAFNQENQDPDWKKVVIVWNGNHAKRNENEIFAKICSLVLQYIIQFGSHTSHSAQICWNVMQVMQILVKCQNHLKFWKKKGSKIQKTWQSSLIAFTCITQVIYIIQFTMNNSQASSTNFTPTCQKYLDVTFKSGACQNWNFCKLVMCHVGCWIEWDTTVWLVYWY